MDSKSERRDRLHEDLSPGTEKEVSLLGKQTAET